MSVPLKIKLVHKDAVIPSYAKPGDVGMDLTAVSFIETESQVIYSLGICMEIPEGYVGLIFPRSSIFKTDLSLSNSVGVIDSQYRGEVKAIFNKNGHKKYKAGERCCQIIVMPYPKVSVSVVDELSSTDRGEGGFGSTGK